MQKCSFGLVVVRRHEGRLAFAAPKLLRPSPVEEALLNRIAEVGHMRAVRYDLDHREDPRALTHRAVAPPQHM